MIKIYLAGAMSNLSWEQMNEWREKATELLTKYNDNVHIENPCHYYNFQLDKSTYTEQEVKSFDLFLVRNCDVVLVNLDYPNSIGTAIEMHMACDEWHKPVIAFGTTINHPWIELSVTKKCDTLEDAVEHIRNFYIPNI